MNTVVIPDTNYSRIHGLSSGQVYTNRKAASNFIFQFDQGFLRVVAQVEEFFGVFLQGVAGVGQDAFARGAVEERFTDFIFELADGLADRGLGAEEFFGGPGEAAFSGYG